LTEIETYEASVMRHDIAVAKLHLSPEIEDHPDGDKLAEDGTLI
jgi:hypothetical protein